MIKQTDCAPLKRPTFKSSTAEIDWLNAQTDSLCQALHHERALNEWLRRQMYGHKSERSVAETEGQETLFGAEVIAVEDTKNIEETEDVRTDAEILEDHRLTAATKKKKNGGGRKPVNPALNVMEFIIEVPAHERSGPNGEKLILLGYRETERTHIQAAEVMCYRFKMEIWGEPDTHDVICTAPPPPSIVAKGKLTDGTINELMYNKYILSLPFFRQVESYNFLGAELNTSICSDMAKRYATFMQPISAAILNEILQEPYVHVDETTMRELAIGHMKQQYLWVWHAGGQSYFHYGGRSSSEVDTVLGHAAKPLFERTGSKNYHGFFMADGLAVYDKISNENPSIQRLACMVHARRYFEKIAANYTLAQEMVTLYNGLFKIERQAQSHCKKEKLHGADAHAYIYTVRQEKSVPALDTIKKRLDALAIACVGITLMEKAINYTINLWDALILYTTNGALPMDNNAAERSIRPITIGRKNYIFVGSEDAGDWCAINYTVLESARCQKISPRWYQNYVTNALHEGRTDYQNLTPKALKPLFKTASKILTDHE